MTLGDEFLTESQVSEILGLKAATLRNWSAARKGPPRISVGRKILYRRAALVAWLESREARLPNRAA